LEAQLRALNLTRRPVDADGNCFFRALADQKYGDESRHGELRRDVVEHVREREESYAPFVEDDESFEEYCERMAQDGEWAGHVEVCAATEVLKMGICIHQAGSPRWVAGAEVSDERVRTYHVSYEGSDHYNSVRVRNYREEFPGGPLSVAVLRDEELVEVCRRTGCSDYERLRRTMRSCRNDVDACVATIRDELEEEEEARARAIADGVDVGEFDGGDWAEVKVKKHASGAGRNKKNGGPGRGEKVVETLEMGTLRI
jgi:OTU domain-containing protein 3